METFTPTLQPTAELFWLTPQSAAAFASVPTASPTAYPYDPTYDPADHSSGGGLDGPDRAALIWSYVSIIGRLVFPVALIVMCIKIRGAADDDPSVLDGPGGAGEEERTRRMRKADRRRLVSEELITKRAIEARVGQRVPSIEEDARNRDDILLPKPAVDGDSDQPLCSICLCPYAPGDIVCWSSNPGCHHLFHAECMSQWLMKHDDCPQCRQDYLGGETDGEEGSESSAGGSAGDEDGDGDGDGGGASAGPAAGGTLASLWSRRRPIAPSGGGGGYGVRGEEDGPLDAPEADLERGAAPEYESAYSASARGGPP